MTYRVLVVDDSKLARMFIARLLDELRPSWTRVEAANAVEAVQRQTDDPADIALLDINMPGADGLSLAADLRDRAPSMPMAIISANIQHEIVARAEAIGATFLAKPLSQQALSGFLDGAQTRLESAVA